MKPLYWFCAFFLLAFVDRSHAQVPCSLGDDGFNPGCCDTPTPNLPNFPDVSVEGVYACLRDCQVEAAFKVKVTISSPTFFQCDLATLAVRVTPITPGAPTIDTRIIAKYSRTWITTHSGNVQVWRFLLNGDWAFGPAIGVAGCPTPPHANPAHVIGSLDYACDPTSPSVNGVQVALNLSHLPGCISHGSFSARPLAGAAAHNNRSYHLVAPNNFTFGSVNDIAGAIPEESVRSSTIGTCFPSTYQCRGEADVKDGSLTSIFKNCLCTTLSGGPWAHQKLEGVVECNGALTPFNSASGFDPVIPTGLAGLRLGSYVGPAWPGDLELTVYTGYLEYGDPCGSLSSAAPHRVSGVGTANVPGFLFSPGPVLQPFEQFVDLQDNLLRGPSPTVCIPLSKGFGAPAYGSIVWNLNPVP